MSVYSKAVATLVGAVGTLGYGGIFVLMFLESSFLPFPSEVVMIPAGYLAYQGKMNLYLVIVFGILGSLAGSWFNYLLAERMGRRVILRFLKEHHLLRVEKFFEDHGPISTFNGRLIPVVRQYISFPAGLAKMNGWKFTIYTGLGAGIWVTVLSLLGYFLGRNEDLLHRYLREISIVSVLVVAVFTAGYMFFKKHKR